MSIKILPTKTVPAVDLDFIQYTNFQLRVQKAKPYKTSLSATIDVYGKDEDNNRYYDTESTSIVERDVDKFVAQLSQENQKKAIQAIGLIQTGLGVLADLKTDYSFAGVE